MNKEREKTYGVILIMLITLTAAASLLGLRYGSAGLTLSQVVDGLLHPGGQTSQAQILWVVRLPHVAACLLAGAGLAVSGVLLQTATDNPLAGPNIIGVNAGAGFAMALGMIYIFAVKLEWFPPYGAKTWKHYILPMATLILPSSVGRMRLARTTMLEAIRQEYVTMARSKGIPENRVIFVHALKNSLIPLITSILTSFSGMLGGTIILENVFGFPGLGAYIINGINTKDAPTVLASTTFLAAIFCLTSLVLDILYALVDPRVKERYNTVKK